jgi:hypothetical protein
MNEIEILRFINLIKSIINESDDCKDLGDIEKIMDKLSTLLINL